MQVALTGLSQSGKTALFTALTEGHCHTEPSLAHHSIKAMVKIPDPRLDKLSEIYKPKKTTPAGIEFLDLPGLSFVDEASRQEARRIVAQARQADMLVLVLRGFHEPAVAAYRNRVDPAKDLDELKSELLLADLEQVENRIEKLEKSVKKPTKDQEHDKRELALLERCGKAIENLQPVSEAVQTPEEEKMLRSFGFLTLKPMRIVLNGDEDGLDKPAPLNQDSLLLSAKLEAELALLGLEERKAFLEELGLEEMACARLTRMCLASLNMITFLTVGEDEVRAWLVPANCPAVEAAGAIHSDIQRGFIRAETINFKDFQAAGDMKSAKAAGKVRLEGKGYPVQDGDIITIRFNV